MQNSVKYSTNLIWKFKIRKKNCAIFIVNFYLALFCEHYRDFKVALAVYYSVKTNSVKFYIDKYPKVLPFCEITPSKSHENYWQKISENN